MDIERLSKSQIILLTLLVSFVSSIATGIITVSLMEQAPPSIAQTVNRVVERTVEKMIPSEQTAAAVIPETIIIKESDLIASAIEMVTPSVVRLFSLGKDAEGKDIQTFLGLGVVIKEDGLILTDVSALPGAGALVITRESGDTVSGATLGRDEKSGLALIQGATSTENGAVSWKPAKVAGKSSSLGETVISVFGRSITRVGNGILTTAPSSDKDGLSIVETNIPASSVVFGSPLINIDGEIEGISTAVSRATSESAFLASPTIIVYTSGTKAEGGASQ